MSEGFDINVQIKAERDLFKRVQARMNRLAPDNIGLQRTLHRIGLLLTNQAKINIRTQKLIDKGDLFNSLDHIVQGNSVVVSPFGIPYAAVHEFGFKGPVTVRGHDRMQTTAWGRPLNPPVMAHVRQHQRMMNIEARPYLRPALVRHQQRILDMLRQTFEKG